MEFQFPAALCKLIAAGYKNVRIDHSLLLELGQKSFLTGNIRYLFVNLHDVLESGPDWLDDFDEQLFSDMVEKIVVVDNETLRFRLLNGLEVTEKIERTRR